MLKESKNPYGYKNLLVYKKADAMQAACAALTSRFPHLKTLYSLADQMDRSARSVKQNVVEGWKRNSTKEYYEFLGFSLGANAELEEDCNDIIKGIYKGLQWDQKGGKGAAGAGRPPQRETPSSHSTHLSPSSSAPLTLEEVERLPFYPIDTHLPPVVRLKLQCKELNFLIHKLQESLAAKMNEEGMLSQSVRISQKRNKEKRDDLWLAEQLKRAKGE